MKKLNKKGFTLAELLIVVAIIAVLVAIAIPVFSGALTKAQEAADEANVRAAYAQAVTDYLLDGDAYPAAKPSQFTKAKSAGGVLNYPSKLKHFSVSTGGTFIAEYSASKIDDLKLEGGKLD